MLGAVLARFVEKSPISVMVRAALERVLGADRPICGMSAPRRSHRPETSCLPASML